MRFQSIYWMEKNMSMNKRRINRIQLITDWCFIRSYFFCDLVEKKQQKYTRDWIFSCYTLNLESVIIQFQVFSFVGFFSHYCLFTWNGHFSSMFVIFNENNAFTKWNWFLYPFYSYFFSRCRDMFDSGTMTNGEEKAHTIRAHEFVNEIVMRNSPKPWCNAIVKVYVEHRSEYNVEDEYALLHLLTGLLQLWISSRSVISTSNFLAQIEGSCDLFSYFHSFYENSIIFKKSTTANSRWN